MNKTAMVFLTDGFEETEALATVDMLRRGGILVTTASLTGNRKVTGSHQIQVTADALFEDIVHKEFDAFVLPGGPGTVSYKAHQPLLDTLQKAYAEDKLLAAICAAPSILGMLGLLKGRKAVCFPGYEKELDGAILTDAPVVQDGRVITSRSAGTSILFGLAIVEALAGMDTSEKVKGALYI